MSDVISDHRTELLAALKVLEPQIRGLHDLVAVSISPELVAEIEAQVAIRERRRGLILALLAAIEALFDDGYPDMPNAVLPPNLFSELRGENTDLDSAVAIFEDAGPATTLIVNLDAPVEKPL